MKQIPQKAALAAVLSLAAASGSAHHSFAMFDMNKVTSVTATVKEFQWTAPHALLWIVEDPRPGEATGKMWTIELSTGPAPLMRVGWTKRSVVPGDGVIVELRPLRSGEPGGSFKKLTIVKTGKVLESGAPDASFDNLPDLPDKAISVPGSR